MTDCPLCFSEDTRRFAACDDGKIYRRCGVCQLIFLLSEHRLSPEDERARYETHENDPSDDRYRDFLSRLTKPLVRRLQPGMKGLDYGCGPGPTISVMLAEQGFRMSNYDPFFAPDTAVLNDTYDFITCTETVEHFHRPAREFSRLDGLLRQGGRLGIMTEMFADGQTDFRTWWYRRDPTHVCFYTHRTMVWTGDRFGWEMEQPHRNVTLFRKLSKDC